MYFSQIFHNVEQMRHYISVLNKYNIKYDWYEKEYNGQKYKVVEASSEENNMSRVWQDYS